MISVSAAYAAEMNKPNRCPIYQVALNKRTMIPTPTAYWKLDETSGTRNDSIGSQHLTDNNTVTSATGRINTAGQFTRANTEYLSIADNATLSTGDIDFTISGWFYLDSKPGSDMNIVTKRNAVGDQREYTVYWATASDRFLFEVYGASGASTVTVTAANAVSPNIGQWYHVVAWHDSVNNEIGIQVNGGGPNTKSTSGGTKNSTADFNIGAESGANTFDGRIDEVGFWKQVLTSEQRTALYNRGQGRSIADFNDDGALLFCTAKPITGEYLGLRVLEPLDLQRDVEPEFGRFPLSEFVFALYDQDQVITPIIASGIIGMSCDLYGSFREIEWSGNAVQFFRGIVTEVTYKQGAYIVTARSPMTVAHEKLIFDGASTRLTSSLSDVATTVNVADTTAFDLAENTPDSARRHVNVNNEILVYNAKTATTFTLPSRVGANQYFVPPGIPGSESVAHASGDIVREVIDVGELTGDNDETGGTNDMHPIEHHFVNILTSGNTKKGIGSPFITLNNDQIAEAVTALGAGLMFRFMAVGPTNAKRFIEDEILLPCACFPTEDNTGRIGVKHLHGREECTFVGTLTDNDIIDFPSFKRNAERLINTVIIHHDHILTTDEFTSTFRYQNPELLGAHGRELTLEIFSKGIRSFFTFAALEWFSETAAFLVDMAERYIARFGNKSPVIQVAALFDKQLFEVGDDIEVTFARVTDMETGTLGLTNYPMTITGMRHNFRDGMIEMTLLGYPA